MTLANWRARPNRRNASRAHARPPDGYKNAFAGRASARCECRVLRGKYNDEGCLLERAPAAPTHQHWQTKRFKVSFMLYCIYK